MARSKVRITTPVGDAGVRPQSTPVVQAPTALAFEPLVRVRNLMGQMVQCSVLTEDGRSQTVRLGAHGVSQPYAASRVDNYTRLLEQRGHLRIEPAH